jgi:superfamily II DNA/RNA helicase
MPLIMQKRSAIILAETGSGKSMAFAAPLLSALKRGAGLKALVVAPTRELTLQIYKEFLILAETWLGQAPRIKLMRGSLIPSTEDGLHKLCQACEILVASPLKLAQLCEKYPTIKSVEYLIVDEADKMFEMGFLEQID